MVRFFFQAEDGIRDEKVTGVHTCALPILAETALSPSEDRNTFRSLPGWVCEDQRYPWRANSRPISGVTGTEV